MPTAGASSSSTELLAGFRVERRLGAETWEAVQPELGRRVALRRLAPGAAFDVARWPEAPGVVRLYAVTETPEGTLLATQFIPGARTLAECARSRPGRRRRWVDDAATIAARAGHGSLTDRDILIGGDGRVWLTGFGRPVVETDEAAVERIRAAQHGRPRLAAGVAAGLAVAGAAAALALDGDGDRDAAQPPRVAAPALATGATAIGSDLAPGALRTVDCEGRPPSGSSITCTVMQRRLGGRPLTAPFEGIAREWSVRGASGRLALQILMPAEDGFYRFNATRIVTVDDPDGTQTFRTDRLVPEGARFGIEIEPGGAVGMRSTAGATIGRFFGLLRRPVERPDLSGGKGEELLLRVDLVRRPG